MKVNTDTIGFELAALGYNGLRGWARARGYNPGTAHNAVHRWIGRHHGLPRGKTAVILQELTRALNRPISPVLKPYFKAKPGQGWIETRK